MSTKTNGAVAAQAPLYLADTYLTEVLTAVVRAGRDSTGRGWLALADNVFHPQGGGQPADRGTVDGIPVLPRRDPDDRGWVLLDLPDRAPTPAIGTAVAARVDRALRRQHAALHTAGHLIEALGARLGWTLAATTTFPARPGWR